MSLRDAVREYKELPLAVLDRPELDARIERDPEKLEELVGNVARNGVILPIAVVRTGARYEIVDGFSRFLAATRAGLVTIPCAIYPTKETALEGAKYAANLFKLDMSPAEEALFFHELFKHECGEDFEKLCALVNRKPSYVNNRLDLITGDEQIFEAVRIHKITLGVAAELNKVPAEDYRRYYLQLAIRDGATVATVTGWVTEWKNMYGHQPPAPASAVVASASIVGSAFDPHYCHICRKSDARHLPEQLPVHTHCKLAILEPLLESYHGSTNSHE